MKITDLNIVSFTTYADRFGAGTPRPRQRLLQTLTSIETDGGASGYYLGGGSHGDQEGLRIDDQTLLLGRIRSLLIGQDPLDRELIWKWLWVANIPENAANVVDVVLWDLAGRAVNLPVYKLLGGARDRVKAYASTYPNIGSPQEYADHALACRAEGYLGYKSTRTISGTRRPRPAREYLVLAAARDRREAEPAENVLREQLAMVPAVDWQQQRVHLRQTQARQTKMRRFRLRRATT